MFPGDSATTRLSSLTLLSDVPETGAAPFHMKSIEQPLVSLPAHDPQPFPRDMPVVDGAAGVVSPFPQKLT
jgi:hypothetical protein